MSINSHTHENWTLKQIYESLTKGKRKIVTLMFQRGKRQNKEMRH